MSINNTITVLRITYRWITGVTIANGLKGAIVKVDTGVFTSRGTGDYESHKNGKPLAKPTFLKRLCIICTPEDDHMFGRPWQQALMYILYLHILILVLCNVRLHYTNTNKNYFWFVLVFMKTIDIKLHRHTSGGIENFRWRKLTREGDMMLNNVFQHNCFIAQGNKVVVLTYTIQYRVTFITTLWCLCSNMTVNLSSNYYTSTYDKVTPICG